MSQGRHALTQVKIIHTVHSIRCADCAADIAVTLHRCALSVQMVANGVKEDPVGKSVDAEGAVCIEDFRGDSATDDIARQAVIKDIVDIEQTGVILLPACIGILQVCQIGAWRSMLLQQWAEARSAHAVLAAV